MNSSFVVTWTNFSTSKLTSVFILVRHGESRFLRSPAFNQTLSENLVTVNLIANRLQKKRLKDAKDFPNNRIIS